MDQRRLLENRRLVVHHMHFELLTYLTPFFSRAQHIFVSDTAHFNHDKKKKHTELNYNYLPSNFFFRPNETIFIKQI